MQLKYRIVLGVASLLGLAAVSAPRDQIRSIQNLIKTPADYHLVYKQKLVEPGSHVDPYTYRYDSCTGKTEFLWGDSPGPGQTIGYWWRPVAEEAAMPSPGPAGRYQVTECDKRLGELVRIDTTTGKTWTSSASGNSFDKKRWDKTTIPMPADKG